MLPMLVREVVAPVVADVFAIQTMQNGHHVVANVVSLLVTGVGTLQVLVVI